MPSALLKSQPHSNEAERTVLGALLLDPEAIVKVTGELVPEDFYDPVHRAIFAAIRHLHDSGKPVDTITVAAALETNEKIQNLGGSAFLTELILEVPTSSHIMQYAKTVAEKSLRRRALELGKTIQQNAFDTDQSAEEVVEAAEQGILQLSRQTSQGESFDLADLRKERFDYYTAVAAAEEKQAFYGLTTGFLDLDTLLTGLGADDLIIIAARPSMGKTAFVIDIAKHITNKLEKRVMFISLEMSKEQVADRIFAGALEVSTQDLKKGLIEEQDFQRMGKVFDSIPEDRFYIDDQCDYTLANLRSKARRQQMEHGLDLLIVDYLQLLSASTKIAVENRVQEVSTISRKLKQLARELKVPVIAVSQLSRNVENRTDKRPQLADLRESGSIEQDADTVLMLYRDDYYYEDTDSPGITEVFIRKQRQGPIGRVKVRFDKERMCHQNLARDDNKMPQAAETGQERLLKHR